MRFFFNSSKAHRLLSLIVSVYLIGCTQINSESVSSLNAGTPSIGAGEKCLSPLFTFAYPDRDENSGLMPPGMLPTTLPQPETEVPVFWTPQLTVSQLNSVSEFDSGAPPPNIRSDIIEIIGDDIWFSDSTYIFRYNNKNRELKSYKVFDVGHINDLYADSQGDLWVAIDEYPTSRAPLLKYNAKQDQFETVLDDNVSIISDKEHKVNQIIERAGNVLWIVFSQQLYMVDLEEDKVSLVSGIDKELQIYDVTMTPDGKFWFVASESKVENPSIYQFDPRTNQVKATGFPLEKYRVLSESVNLESDEKGRVWVNNLGWFEPIPDENIESSYPYPIVRSFSLLPFAGFIGQGTEYQYVMALASYVNSFSDSTIWFSSSAGISQLNPSTGEWCILARNVPGIALAEDSDHFVWFAYGQLYKYDLSR